MIRKQIDTFFGDGTPLKSAKGFTYEPRPQQVQMAQAVADAMDDGQNLCVEAPTGVGKTFAYLVPAVLLAKETGKAVIVSTHTINLQEQIISRDIPLLRDMMGCDIRAVVAKGRTNYLCLRRLSTILDMDQELIALDGISGELARLRRWAGATSTGDYAELPNGISSQLWHAVCSERGNCLGSSCDFFKRCFQQKAKRAVHDAEIIISNHAKFFTALVMDEAARKLTRQLGSAQKEPPESMFPEHAAVILDEGHTIEDCASSHLGLRAESFALRHLLNRLWNNDRKTGLLLGDLHAGTRAAVTECARMCDLFFQRLVDWLVPQKDNPLRYQVPNHIPNCPGAPLERVLKCLDASYKQETDEAIQAEMQGIALELEEQANALQVFFSMSEPGFVYWFEREGKAMTDVSLNVVPIDVAPRLSDMLFSKAPVIVTSATLAVNNDIGYFQRRVGCESARALILDTPFDYENQVQLYLGGSLPDPNSYPFTAQAAEQIRHFLLQTKGRAFVLFTSYKAIKETAELLKGFFEEENLTLLIQGGDLSPRKMLEKFREHPGSVIFGTSSFWTGVDVPGDALSNVIIVKLPFAVPTHPLVAARMEKVAQTGTSSFGAYSVPEAVLKFRQGFGRLIRTRSDKGIVVILDSRIVTKSYGRVFVDSIPHCPTQVF